MNVKIKRRYYVKFYYPGTFFAETSTIESLKEKSIKQILKLKESKSAFAFDKSEREILIKDGKIYKGEVINNSVRYYIDGELFSPADIESMNLKGHLLDNMQINKWDYVIKTRCGWYWPFEVNNVIIKSDDFK